jgi:membrane protein implicated in regulation of membrane protease activity
MTTRIAEGAVLVIGIASLWPWILGYREPWYTGVLVAVLVLLALLAVRRFRRIQRAFRDIENGRNGAGAPPQS